MPGQPFRRPTQAVILAGGRGTRLLPLTADKPKPMVAFHGRPFLEYLLEQLHEQGIRRVLLLLGYLPNVVVDYFGDGKRLGLSIEYMVTDVDDETGTRLRAARPLIDPVFFLLYCDNYVPFSLASMWERWSEIDASALVTVYANDDGYTRSNLRVDSDGRIALYDRSRKAADLQGVDIGYMLARREIIDLLPHGNVSFEATVYPQLIARHRLFACVTRHRYYSVGDHRRLSITGEFLRRRRSVVIDLATLMERPADGHIRTEPACQWRNGALEALHILKRHDIQVAIVNWRRGRQEPVDDHRQMLDEVRGRVDGVFGPERAGVHPAETLLFQAQRTLHLDLTKTVYLGSEERGLAAAVAAGCPTRRVGDGAAIPDIVAELVAREASSATG